MSDCYESMSRTPIRDRPLRQPLIRHSRHPFAIRGIPSPIRPPIRHSGEGRNPEGWGEGNIALGLVSSLGRAAHSPRVHRPASHHFHPLMRPSQGHGDSGDRRHAPYPDTGPESRRGGATPLIHQRPTSLEGRPLWVPRTTPKRGQSEDRGVQNFVRVSHRTSPARKVLFIYELSMMGEVSSVS